MRMNFLEIVNRGQTGPAVLKEDWDLDWVIMNVRDTLEEFGLSDADLRATLLVDDELARRYYAAGRALLIKTGVYMQDTGRVIELTPEEIDAAAAAQRKEMTVGSGKDAFTFYARRAEDPRRPGVAAGNPGCPMDERIFALTVESWAKEPSIDMVTCGSIVELDGFIVERATPAEVLAVRRELRALNAICDKVGRPGIGRLASESSVSELGDLSAMAPGYIRDGDAHLVALNNELMITNDNLVRAANTIDTGVLNASLACVMIGGLAGGPAGAAITMIASMLAANIVARADYHLCHPIHLRHIATSTRECMWLQSVVCQAFALCAPAIIVCDIYPKCGAGTKELLYEVAANALAITVSGGHLEGVGSCDGIKPNCSGLEARLMGEVAAAAARQGLTRGAAEEIVNALYAKYARVFAEGGKEGLPFEQVYDARSMTPVASWFKMYEETVAELRALGLAL